MSENARTDLPETPGPAPATHMIGSSGRPDANGSRHILDWLPWEKITIWGLVLLGIWVLKDFFFVIFMTFLLTYIMRSIIVRVVWLIARRRHAPLLERMLAIVGFALLLWGSYLVGSWLWPPVQSQFHVLKGRVQQFDPNRLIEEFGTKTVGALLFNREYGSQGDETYDEAYKKWIEESEVRERPLDLQSFEEIYAEVLGASDPSRTRERLIEEKVRERALDDSQFRAWFVSNVAPDLYAKDKDALDAAYEAGLSKFGSATVASLKNEPNYEEVRRDSILESLFGDLSSDMRESYRRQWRETLREEVRQSLPDALVASAVTNDIETVYEEKRKLHSHYPPFERFLELRDAYERSKAENDKAIFYAALGEPTETDEATLRRDFELAKQEELWAKWWKTPFAQEIRGNLDKLLHQLLADVAGNAQGAVSSILNVPVQLSLSLLLSFFITFDIPRLRRGVQKLKKSRVKHIYAEIAPGLISFGHLIGRAFQAQGVIAIFNTLLTFLAIRFLGIDNEVFLCAIVFICSFIPVLGVVLSSVPIAIMAIIQPGGSFLLAVEITVAIIIIHFIETSILNPKILGDMLHLHPVLVLAVLSIGGHFFGVWGLLLGVPVVVYIIRFVILNEGIPGLIEPHRAAELATDKPPPSDAETALPSGALPPPESDGDARDDEGERRDSKGGSPEDANGDGIEQPSSGAQDARSAHAGPLESRKG